MGVLVNDDSLLARRYFKEMARLIGVKCLYQYITNLDLTIHSEDNSRLSTAIPLDILLDEHPTIHTMNRLGWLSEINEETKPIIATLPFDTPNLTVNARITLASIDGVQRPRVFKITKIVSDFEYPDTYTVALVPVFDQIPQKNQYELVNLEKTTYDSSNRTSKEQPYMYLVDQADLDTTPQEYKDWTENFTYLNDEKSPYED